MVTPLTSPMTNNPEIVDFLLEKSRKLEDIQNFLMKMACDIARGKVAWNEAVCEMVCREVREFKGDLSRAEVVLCDFILPKGGE